MIILMAGLPGTGKTTLARELARLGRGTVLNKDEIRAALFSPRDIEYSTTQDDFCTAVMLHAARYVLRNDPERRVFLDGRTFSRKYQIDHVVQFAEELQQHWVILECTCSEESARRRLEFASDPSHPARNRTFQLYLEIKARFEPIAQLKTVISTDQPLEACVQQASAAVA